MCPGGGYLFPDLFPKTAVCHCLLIETPHRLVLVDTGIGVSEMQRPWRLGPMSPLLNVQRDRGATAFEQVQRFGFSPADVTDLILTHLDLDHAGGIPDFKNAVVHVSRDELETARARPGFKLRMRYRPGHLLADSKWTPFTASVGERWNGFECVRALPGLPAEILAVRLPGHTHGHFGVAVKAADEWLLHAGDAYYSLDELRTERKKDWLRETYRGLVHFDAETAFATQGRLAELKKAHPQVRLFCSHDPREFALATS